MAEKEYIEREAAIKAVCDCVSHSCDIRYCGFACSEADALSKLPAAEVRPVVRGRWKHDKDGLVWCLNCGFGKERSDERTYHFCPNCGADMRPEPPKEE